ncbi:MAG: His-Xaa-Ser system protein HxsD [Acidobacteriota bacterium]
MAVSVHAGEPPSDSKVTVEIDLAFVSADAVLKACHWFSHEYACDLRKKGDAFAEVVLAPRDSSSVFDPHAVKDAFTASALDFALREKIEAKTSGIRELLLAKAFSESGVLEDAPEGVFGDAIEEAKPDGMFKILSTQEA